MAQVVLKLVFGYRLALSARFPTFQQWLKLEAVTAVADGRWFSMLGQALARQRLAGTTTPRCRPRSSASGRNKVSPTEAGLYVVVQFAGAMAAEFVYTAVLVAAVVHLVRRRRLGMQRQMAATNGMLPMPTPLMTVSV